ncbi:hypothetical protein GCM10010245_91510 [Streptomyces spectabilis]|nr:hypothetical protein GCM10010245_91510 [Streptomyces spectabilis]
MGRRPGRSRAPKTLWLWWTGPSDHAPDPDLIWRACTRGFDMEHVRHEALVRREAR